MISTCHVNRIAHCKGLCKSCYDKWLKSVNPEYRQRQINNTSEWFKRNPEKRQLMNESRKARYLADPLRHVKNRARALKYNYGITTTDYEVMLLSQEGGCAICRRAPGKRPLHVDHDHSSGKVRGLLCHQCNWYLGTIESESNVLGRLTQYVKDNGVEKEKLNGKL